MFASGSSIKYRPSLSWLSMPKIRHSPDTPTSDWMGVI